MSNLKGFTIIKVKKFVDLGTACPTQFEFEDEEGNEYYFRLRHGYSRLDQTNPRKVLISAPMDDGLDGVCEPRDMIRWAYARKFLILNIPNVNYERILDNITVDSQPSS